MTIFGDPGIGKSRLVREFFAGLERTTVLTGRSLPFGEGLAYEPLAEMVQDAAGISPEDSPEEAFEKLREACSSDAVADLLGLASGVLDTTVSGSRRGQEIAWAAQEWATSLAEAQPLVLGFEDVHQAEEPLLDLIEHLADRVDDAPVLIVCLARRSSLELRPGWGGGRRRSITIDLGPLPEEDTALLVDALVADAALPGGLRRRSGQDGGEPALHRGDDPDARRAGRRRHGRADPDTVQALIASRIDRLPPASRSVVRHGALVGRVFWRGAVAELDPSSTSTPRWPTSSSGSSDEEPISTVPGEVAFRFRHVLIRDVAYSGLAKGQQARLHRTCGVAGCGPRTSSWRRRPTTSSVPPRCSRSSRARCRPISEPRLPTRSSEPAAALSRARRTAPHGGCCSARSSSSPASGGGSRPPRRLAAVEASRGVGGDGGGRAGPGGR